MFIKTTHLRCIDNSIVLKLLTVIVMVRELMEEGEGVQRLVQVTNYLTKDSFFSSGETFSINQMGGVGLVLGVWGPKAQIVKMIFLSFKLSFQAAIMDAIHR